MKYMNKVMCRQCGHVSETGVVTCSHCGNRLIYSVVTANDGTVCCNLTDTADAIVLAKTFFGPWRIVRYGEAWDEKGQRIPEPSLARRDFKFPDVSDLGKKNDETQSNNF